MDVHIFTFLSRGGKTLLGKRKQQVIRRAQGETEKQGYESLRERGEEEHENSLTLLTHRRTLMHLPHEEVKYIPWGNEVKIDLRAVPRRGELDRWRGWIESREGF